MPLLAGTACVNIDPPVGTWMAGFAARNKGAEGIHDSLHSKALVLDDGATRVCIITNDLLGFGTEDVRAMREQIESTTGIPGSHVLINCSHTHSGPMRRDADYLSVLTRKVVGAARMAEAALQPARIGIARGPVQVGVNRREWRDGQTILGRAPDKPVAPYVDVLRVDAGDGSPIAVVFSHACHAVTMAADNYLISADYPGAAQRVVEGIHAGATAMFMQGCAGNVNSEPVGGAFEDVRRLGTMLAGAVLEARERAVATDDVRLAVAQKACSLPCAIPTDVEDARRELAEMGPLPEGEPLTGADRYRRMRAEYLQEVIQAHDTRTPPKDVPFDLQAVAIGDIAIVGLPGEVFVEYALHAEAVSPFAHTLALGYTNGVSAYVPTAAEIPFGGYEVDMAPCYYGHLPFDTSVEARLNEAVEGLLKDLQR